MVDRRERAAAIFSSMDFMSCSSSSIATAFVTLDTADVVGAASSFDFISTSVATAFVTLETAGVVGAESSFE